MRLGILAIVVSACAQQPPARAPLPEVADVVTPPPPCSFVVGSGTGIEVSEVEAGTPAEGILEAGDVIVGADGVGLRSSSELFDLLERKEVGDPLVLDLERGGSRSSATITLGAHPDDATRPLIGVSIATRFDHVEIDDVEHGTAKGVFSRLVDVDGMIYSIDPVEASVRSLGLEAPDPPWFSAGGRIYRVTDPGTIEATVVDLDGVELDLGPGIVPVSILGALEGDLLLAVYEVAPDALALSRVGARLGELDWQVATVPDQGFPVAMMASPDGARLLVASTFEGREGLEFSVWNASTGRRSTDTELSALDGGVGFGWFDQRRVVGQLADGTVALVTVDTGEVEPITLPVSVQTGGRMWAVGDGTHLLVLGDDRLLRVGLAQGVETRELVTDCDIGHVDLSGPAR